MNDLMNKISSYNLFNYLLPGAIFIVFIEKITTYKILQSDMLINAFIIYFLGLIISRIGSLLIEPILKKIVKFAKYEDFITASKEDEKINILSESNNMYRTFISLFSILIIFKLYDNYCLICKEYNIYIVLLFLLILFVFSYLKQTKYITKRVNSYVKRKNNEHN